MLIFRLAERPRISGTVFFAQAAGDRSRRVPVVVIVLVRVTVWVAVGVTVGGRGASDQDRRATTVQLSEVFSTVHQGLLGQHLFKAGLDVLYTDYAETSTNRKTLLSAT